MEFALIIVCIFLSAFFSGSEIAFFSLNEAKIKMLVDKGAKNSKLIDLLKRNQERLLVTILVGNNIVNIGASAVMTSWATETFGSSGVGIATGIMTLLVLTFGEIVPKSLATNFPGKVAQFASIPIFILQIILTPFSILFEKLSRLLVAIFKRGRHDENLPEDEVMALTEIAAQKGQMEKYESNVITGVFKLNDLKVSTVMTKKENIFAFDGEKKIVDVIQRIKEKHYSRIPVFMHERENYVGYIQTKDLLLVSSKKFKELKVKNFVKEILFVDEDELLKDLYRKLIGTQIHIALVTREREVIGLVTIEDIIEEVLGEIYDEKD